MSSILPAWASRVCIEGVLHRHRPSRIRQWVQPGYAIDVRRTYRLWLKSGAMRMRYVRRQRYTRPGRLVVLWDVSGSMAETISLYLPWLHRLAASSRDVGVFPFGVRVADLTEDIRKAYPTAVQAMADMPGLWESGTSIGLALQDWTTRHSTKWLRGRSTVLIISDGWDSGTPEAVANALRAFCARDARIVWMHPLLRSPGFELKTRALLAARPYVDQWLPGGSPEDLLHASIS
ncbi:VWA domain-containing protein [Alicyclobacillus dauci]|uniref:VWA domain-containing protein n=1 Tax=Alicyclobacillus dauci TaxID=1475485 RepID=A0ABY6Z4E3_9BACL|nr:VWA domain-containing protein [Alicyclobacillus dauci]WAH37752.1 VWA domain-containing protein [Alicyclobacillus dauci]